MAQIAARDWPSNRCAMPTGFLSTHTSVAAVTPPTRLATSHKGFSLISSAAIPRSDRSSQGALRTTLDLDVFNTLNCASTLRQVGDAAAATFRNPLEIVAPRLVRLGLRLQF